MHPILGDRRRLAIYVLAWLLVGLLLVIGLRGETAWVVAGLFFVPLTMAFAFVALSSWYVCRAFPLRDGGATVLNIVVVQLIAAAFASTLWVGMASVWAGLIDRLVGTGAIDAIYPEQQPVLFVTGALLFWLGAAFHYLVIAFETSREAETRVLESTLLAREAELRAIRAQIDPHFIFNSLHSVSALTTIDPAAARQMCLLLADFLRDTLRFGSTAQITLAEELALAERFLAIEQVRLGARLRVVCEADPGARECPVPPLLLQPLVENAVVHGIAPLIEGGTIRLTARRAGGVLAIVLENPCDPDRARSGGVGLGLALLRRRLAAQFGTRGVVQAKEQGGLFRIEIRVPAPVAAPVTATVR